MVTFIIILGVIGLIVMIASSDEGTPFGAGIMVAAFLIILFYGVFKTNAHKELDITKQFVIENKAQFIEHAEQKRDSLYKAKSFDELKKFEKHYYSILEDIE